MSPSDCETTLIESLNVLFKSNKLSTARKILDLTKDTFSRYQEFDTKLRELETKHE
jgi:hypothetical protein